MTKQQIIEEINLLLIQESYEDAITFLEDCLEKKSEELTYYWYLGLVYLLQENEVLAQEIWLSLFLQGSLEEVEQWTLELTEFLEIKVEENIAARKLGNAKIIYETIFVINSDYENPELLHSLVESLSYLALGLIDENNRIESIDVYREILKLHPQHTLSWYSLAANYYHLEQYNEAEASIKKAIELDELSADNYHILGLILEKKDDTDITEVFGEFSESAETKISVNKNRISFLTIASIPRKFLLYVSNSDFIADANFSFLYT
jgi:tetratricopeptide (TPR) repeat protein